MQGIVLEMFGCGGTVWVAFEVVAGVFEAEGVVLGVIEPRGAVPVAFEAEGVIAGVIEPGETSSSRSRLRALSRVCSRPMASSWA